MSTVGYDVLMVDPPWPQRKGGKRAVRPGQGRELDYQVMSIADIFSLLDHEIFPLVNSTNTVFLWAIDRFLHEAENEMTQRGYRLHARLIWDKGNGIAPAFSIRFSHEYLLWFYRPKFQQVDRNQRGKQMTVFHGAKRQHSRKPDAAYRLVESLYPDAERLDVFSRESRLGWSQFGDQKEFFT